MQQEEIAEVLQKSGNCRGKIKNNLKQTKNGKQKSSESIILTQ